MSLINEALRDLEDRHSQSSNRPSGNIADCVEASSRNTSEGFRSAKLAVLVSVVCIGAYFVGGLSNGPIPFGDTTAPQLVEEGLIKKPTSNAKGNNRQLSEVLTEEKYTLGGEKDATIPANESGFQNSNIHREISDEIDSEIKTKKIDRLIALTERSIERNRLSVPASGSALYYLSEISRLEPDNDYAKKRRKDIQNKYITQLESALNNDKGSRFETLISRAPIFSLKPSETQSYIDRFNQVQERVQKETLASEVGPVRNLAASGFVVASPEALDDVEETQQWVKEAGESKIKKEFESIQQAFNDDPNTTFLRLQLFIDHNPNHIESNLMKFDYLIGRNEYVLAQEQVLSLGSDHYASEYMAAKLAQRFHGVEKAIGLLESQSIDERIFEKQGAYLGALYHKTSRFDDAKAVFGKLIKRDHKNPQYVLGYALANDALGLSEEAYRAFSTLVRIGHPQDSVITYANKRLRVLKPNSLAEANVW